MIALEGSIHPIRQRFFASNMYFPENMQADKADGLIALSPAEIGLSAIVLLANAALSLRLDLGLHMQLMVAAARMVLQVGVLGYILAPLFAYNRWWMVVGYAFIMLTFASLEAVQRPQYSYKGILLNTMVSMGVTSATILTYAVFVVLHLSPWFDAQYFIPILGMLLGNATAGVAIGISAALDELAMSRDPIEQLLSMGASRYEAALPTIRRAIQKAFTPIINSMSMLGLVSIPGMMTGQILSGSDPAQAARYQMMIMFLISGTSAFTVCSSVYLAVFHIVDNHHCYRPDRLLKKHGGDSGGQSRLRQSAKKAGSALAGYLQEALVWCVGRPSPRSERVKSDVQDAFLQEALLPPDDAPAEADITIAGSPRGDTDASGVDIEAPEVSPEQAAGEARRAASPNTMPPQLTWTQALPQPT